MVKSSLLLKKLTNFTVNKSRILRIKNVKFSGYCFYMNTNIYWYFQICISVPLIIILKDFIKQPAIKQSQPFLSFSLLIDCCVSVFSLFLSKHLQVLKNWFSNFEKRFHWQAFIVYKTGENLKILMEIFYQKLMVFNVILAFLDHLKPKIFFVGEPWWPT